MNALVHRDGGMQAAQKTLDEYESLIVRQQSHIAQMHPEAWPPSLSYIEVRRRFHSRIELFAICG